VEIKFFLDTTGLTPHPEHWSRSSPCELRPRRGIELVQQALDLLTRDDWYAKTRLGLQLGNATFYQEQNGLYMKTDSILDDPPPILREQNLPVRLVTLRDEGWDGPPKFTGMRNEGDAQVVVDTNAKSVSSMTSRRFVRGWQIEIKARRFETVIDLYRQFRRGELRPTERWALK
jgi:hypothetical protein